MAQRQTPAQGGGPGAVRVWLLGGFRVSVGSRTVGAGSWRLRKAAKLVKLLALAPGHRLHRGRIMDLLWPDLDAGAAANNLHRALHFARRTLEPAAANATSGHLALQGGLLSLGPDGRVSVDVEVFEEAAATARHAREPAAYRAAMDLYAGELLPEDRYEVWTEERREALRGTYLTLLIRLAQLHEEREEYEPAIEALRQVVAQEPTAEEAHVGLMRLSALAGRRHEAILQYGRLQNVLSRNLGTEPAGASRRLYGEIKTERFPTGPSPSIGRPSEEIPGPSRHNLPVPLTSFVGRRGELIKVSRSLSMTRLLTLTGAGGSGKTRLALEVARDLAASYPDGVWLAELAPLSDPALVPRAVAAALGVREQPERALTETLCDHLGSGRALLVLDNCEHLVDAAARLAWDLLSACPQLRVLTTSREALGISGETVWPVPTLSLPDPNSEATVEALMGAEAVRLFLDRARSRLPAFELIPENAPAVARICRELDGIPLAIELSTARMGALAVEQVAERLAGSLGFLTGGDRTAAPRHQTLRATLDWSYALLSGPERKLFGQLSVFAGGWTLEAAEAVGAGDGIDEDGVLDILSRLVDKSVVVVEPAGRGGLRYAMLEPVRQYGEERLETDAEVDAVRRRHASWYFGLAQEIEPWSRGARHEVWLERLECEYGNLRSALRWALESGEADLGLWFGGALAEFWYMSENLAEARRWLEAALANGEGARPTPARTRALVRAGWIAWEQGDYDGSAALSEASLALSRELGDEAGAVAALSNLGWAALLGDDLDRASALSEEAVELGRAIGDAGGVARALLVPGLAAVVRQDYERAESLHEESLRLAHEARDGVAAALSLGMGVFAALGRDDVPRAQELCKEGFDLAPRPTLTIITTFHLYAAAALAGSRGQPSRAARLWAAAGSFREKIGATISPVELRVYGPHIASARAKLDGAAWEEARAEGEAMTEDEAIEHALAEGEEERLSRPRHSTSHKELPAYGQPDDALSRREREVALLVGRGLTNRQIAGELWISEHTVAAHLRKILKKLRLRSRAQIVPHANPE